MKIGISRKDALLLLQDLETKVRMSGDVATAVAIELGRASIKRVPTLTEIRYVDPGNGMYMDVEIKEEPREQAKE